MDIFELDLKPLVGPVKHKHLIHFMLRFMVTLKICFVWMAPLTPSNFKPRVQNFLFPTIKRIRTTCCLCARTNLITWVVGIICDRTLFVELWQWIRMLNVHWKFSIAICHIVYTVHNYSREVIKSMRNIAVYGYTW